MRSSLESFKGTARMVLMFSGDLLSLLAVASRHCPFQNAALVDELHRGAVELFFQKVTDFTVQALARVLVEAADLAFLAGGIQAEHRRRMLHDTELFLRFRSDPLGRGVGRREVWKPFFETFERIEEPIVLFVGDLRPGPSHNRGSHAAGSPGAGCQCNSLPRYTRVDRDLLFLAASVWPRFFPSTTIANFFVP